MRFQPDHRARIGALLFVAVLLIASAPHLGGSQQEQKQATAPAAVPAAAAVPDVLAQPGSGDPNTRLLKLAIELKAAVDKSNKDTLSLTVIRKADEIARTAHEIKDKLKTQAAAPSDGRTQ